MSELKLCLIVEKNLKDVSQKSLIERLWIDKKTGYPCAVLFVRNSHRCGYVGIPKGHKFYNKDYGKIDNKIDVHGGLTFSEKDFLVEGYNWFGFDCAHAGDRFSAGSPARVFMEGLGGGGHFWTKEEVIKEVESMALQFKKYEKKKK